MPLQAQQICSLARQIAKCPGYTTQSGQLLNVILADLCQDYDFEICKKTTNFNFNTGQTDFNGYIPGCGPNLMPADFLRAAHKEAFYNIQGTIYKLVGVEQFEFDAFVQSAGSQSYPSMFYVDMSQSPPALYVYWPASGAYPATVRYYSQMPDIATPETSAVIPWFPNQKYLVTRTAGELMMLTNDDRAERYLGDTETADGSAFGAAAILKRYLKLKDDPENKVHRVQLDRRFFRGPNNLKNTKLVGW